MKGGLWQKPTQKAMAAGIPTAMNFAPEGDPYRGARTMTTWRPSKFGSISTFTCTPAVLRGVLKTLDTDSYAT